MIQKSPIAAHRIGKKVADPVSPSEEYQGSSLAVAVAPAQTLEFRINGLPGAQSSKCLTRWGSMRESSAKVGPLASSRHVDY